MFDTNTDGVDYEAIASQAKQDRVKLSPFDFITAINTKKTLDLTDPAIEAQYEPFVINRGYLQAQYSVGVAAMLDRYNGLDKRMQYELYYHMLPKKKGFTAWSKPDKSVDDQIVLLKEVYGYSRVRCLEVLPLIKDWKALEQRVSRGGRS